MRSPFLTSAALLLALGAASPATADELNIPPEERAVEAVEPETAVAIEAMSDGAEGAVEPAADEPVAQAPAETMTSEEAPATAPKAKRKAAARTYPSDLKMPARGMHMDQVEQMFGRPQMTEPAIGEPPITRWRYSGYTVYFEHAYVINSVQDR